MRTAPWVAGACVVASWIAWSSAADAFKGYPLLVDMWLGKDGLIEMTQPPMGCQLCHVDPAGGTVEIKAFANELVAAYGLPKAVEEDAVLMGVLAELQAANPMLYADMQKGIDPNEDPALTAHQLPQPLHGCSAAGPGLRAARDWAALLFAVLPLAAALFRRSRRVVRRDGPE